MHTISWERRRRAVRKPGVYSRVSTYEALVQKQGVFMGDADIEVTKLEATKLIEVTKLRSAVYLEEYKALRAEIIQSIVKQHQILSNHGRGPCS
jgi:hypothetical protein